MLFGAIFSAIAERGQNYYLENKVRYRCIDGIWGQAMVEGKATYEVEFCYQDGQISNLICDCFCKYHCKHEVAAMLQLRETLERGVSGKTETKQLFRDSI